MASAIFRNSLWTISGNIGPLLAVIVFMPLTVNLYSTDHVGLIVMLWAVLGYFGLLDLGLSRAMTYSIAAEDKNAPVDNYGQIVGSGIAIAFGIGIIVAAALRPNCMAIAQLILGDDSALVSELTDALKVAALALPVILVSTILRGALEGLRDFRFVSFVKLGVGTVFFAAPVLAFPLGGTLAKFTLIVAIARLLAVALYGHRLFMMLGLTLTNLSVGGTKAGALLKYGSWLSVSQFIIPILAYIDRFYISNALGPSEVAFYGLPHEVLLKSIVFPASIVIVLFPSFVKGSINSDHVNLKVWYQSSLSIISTFMFLFALTSILLASPVLQIWVGEEFATRSTLIVQIIAIGCYANALMRVPLVHVQATGYPARAALIHVIQLPAYLLVVLPIAVGYGIEGVALAWTGRCIIEYWLLLQQSYAVASRSPCNRLVFSATALVQPTMLTMVLLAHHYGYSTGWLVLAVVLALCSLTMTTTPEDIRRLRQQFLSIARPQS